MQFPIKIDFTTKEWEIIADRLGLPDCLADALEGVEEGYTREAIEAAAERLHTQGRNLTIANQLEWAVFEDSIDGSTFPARIVDARTYGTPKERDWGRGMNKVTLNIERKVLDVSGIQVLFPK